MAPLSTRCRTRSCRRCGSQRKWHVCTTAAAATGHHPPDMPPAADPDLISDLPDELLCAIVSFLPAKDGAHTQALSRRWRPIWPAAALDLEDERDFKAPNIYGGADLAGVITRILSAHRGRVRQLRLAGFYYTPTIIDGLFQHPALDKLEELHFRYRFVIAQRDPLPLSALRFSELRVASYGRCRFPKHLGGAVAFPKLRELTLYELTISESTLGAMISACPDLRSMFLRDSVGLDRVCVNSPTLVRLGIVSPSMEELVVVNAPSMEKLLLFDKYGGPRNVRVMFAPKLEVLGCLSNDMYNIELQSTVFKKLVAISPIEPLQAVKVFSLTAQDYKLDNVMDFLRCFPCLEKLYFMPNRSYWKDGYGQMPNGSPSIECLDRHLKEIVLIYYEGSTGGVKFAEFFAMNARVLKVIEVQLFSDYSKKWKAKQKRLLPKRKYWASQAAKLNFVHRAYFGRRVEDSTREMLSYDNPFGC
ncbi:unnamed protein product [Urochloa decumbens]|uniref:F-box domain-containing protein n=1 Tax=Urochloa decumbens TaxID=240449 RepID=A0ABC9G806_9POAL